jgi:hypothetical protein
MRSPFTFLFQFENALLRAIERLHHLREKSIPQSKIYDIKSGEPIGSDEQFMDAMLARISLYGEETLTAEEKQRMVEISKKKSSRG